MVFPQELQIPDLPSHALELVFSSALPMTLHAAIQLGIFEIIAQAGGADSDIKLSPQEIANRLGTQNPNAPMMLDRILRLLASHSVVSCSVSVDQNGNPQRLYGLTPVCKYFIKNKDGVSLAPLMTLIHDKVFLDGWSHIKDAVMEGGVPLDKAHGMGIFEYAAKDSRFNDVFNKSMVDHSSIVMKEIIESYKGFKNLKQLVDVGGGVGAALNLITSKYPSIKGINYDLPHVIQNAPPYPGIEHVGGDMFQSVPKGDVIFMKWILHDWSDEHCLKLLKNCYNSLPEDGKVIVVDAIVPEEPGKDTGSKVNTLMDGVVMLIYRGGKERTKQDMMKLATSAGFSGIKYECLVFNYWVMEFVK